MNRPLSLHQAFSLLLWGIFLLTASNLRAQCGCANCPAPIPDFNTRNYILRIDTAGNNDLANPFQGVCQVNLRFRHTFVGDLKVFLTSPAGQTVNLIGPAPTTLSGQTDFTLWDVRFVPCGNPAFPDPGFPAAWTNNVAWGFFQNFTGSYYPHVGCLEDFDNGPVTGFWTLTISDENEMDIGLLEDFEIQFCDPTGLVCLPCLADAGEVPQDTLLLCTDDPDSNLLFRPELQYINPAPDSTEYRNTLIIARNDTIVDYADSLDLSAAPAGVYQLCGISYALRDSAGVPMPGEGALLSGLSDALTSTLPPFCGQISDSCLTLVLQQTPEPLDTSITLCVGDSLEVGDTILTSSGSYTFSLLTAGGCDSIINLELTVLDSIFTPLDTTICAGEVLQVGNLFFNTSGFFEVLIPGGSALGCDSTVLLNLTVADPVAEILPPDTLTCALDTLWLNGSLSSPDSALQYTWKSLSGNGAASVTDSSHLAVNAPGTYRLIAAQPAGGGRFCLDSTEVIVAQDTASPLSVAGPDTLLDCLSPAVQLDGSASEPPGMLDFLWQGPGGFTDSTPDPQVDQSGAYLLIVTNQANGCRDSSSLEVASDTLRPEVSATAGAVTCLQTLAELQGISSNPDVSYLWSGPLGFTSSQPDTSTSIPGLYTLTVTLPSGCSSSAEVEVAADTAVPQLQLSTDTLSCADTLAQLSATTDAAGPSFQWSGPGFSASSADTATITPGWYSLTVTAANGCSRADSVRVEIDTLSPPLVAFGDTLTCVDTSVWLSAQSQDGVSLSWSGPTGPAAGDSLLTTLPGLYTVTALASNGCSRSREVSVGIDTLLPQITLLPSDTLSCQQSETQLRAEISGGPDSLLLSWLDPTGLPAGNSDSLTVSEAGTYLFELLVPRNGCRAVDSITVVQDLNDPVADAGPSDTLTCLIDSLLLGGSATSTGAAFRYAWTNENGDTLGNQPQLIVVQPGEYTLLVENIQNGCRDTSTVAIFQNKLTPKAQAMANGDLSCAMPSVILDAGLSSPLSGIQFFWLSGTDTLASGITTNVEQAGSYRLLAVNPQNGCTDSTSLTVEIDTAAPTALAQALDTFTCAQDSIELSGQGSSQGPQIIYQWITDSGNPVGIQPDIVVGTPQTYHLIVTDIGNGCRDTAQVTPPTDTLPPVAQAGPDALLTCQQDTLSLDGSGSTGTDLSFQWFLGNDVVGNKASIVASAVGAYILQVTQASNGCSATDTVLLSADTSLPQISAGPDRQITCTDTTTLLTGSGEAGLVFSWTLDGLPVGADDTLLATGPGLYLLTGTDTLSGCSAADTALVSINDDLPPLNLPGDTTLNCVQPQITIDGSLGDTVSYSYSWTDPTGAFSQSTPQLTLDASSPDTLILEKFNPANNCRATDTLLVIVDTLPPMLQLPAAVDTLNCERDSVLLEPEGSSSGPGFNYLWSGPGGLSGPGTQFLATRGGTYQLTLTRLSNGCSASDSLVVIQDTLAPTAAATSNGPLTCVLDSALLDGSSSSGAHGLFYEWRFNGQIVGESAQLLVGAPGNYRLLVRDSKNECRDTLTLELKQNIVPPAAQITGADTLDCRTDTLLLGSAGSQNNPPWVYLWSVPGDVLSAQSELEVTLPSTYILEVTDTTNGCTAADEVQILQDTLPPQVEVQAGGILDCLTDSVLLSGTGAGPNLQYAWQSGGTLLAEDSTFSAGNPGVYTLLLTDPGNGCSAADSVTVLQDTTSPLALISANTDTLTCSQTDATLSGSDSQPMADLAFVWQENGLALSEQIQLTLERPGTFKLIVTDTTNGCRDTATQLIGIDTLPPQLIILPPAVLNCTQAEVLLDAGLSDAGPSFSFEWSPESLLSGAGSLQPLAQAAGWYTLSIENLDNGCLSVDSVQVEVDSIPPLIVVDAPDTITCSQSMINLDAAGSQPQDSLQFLWTSLGAELLSGAQSPFPEVGSGGAVSLLLTDTTNGCVSRDTIIIPADTLPPFLDAGADFDLGCEKGPVSLSANVAAGADFDWEALDGQILEGNGSLSPLVSAPGAYQLSATDPQNGCSALDTIQVTQVFALVDAVAGGDLSACPGDDLALMGNLPPDASGLWSSPTGATVEEPQAPVTLVSGGLEPGENLLVWTLSTDNCPDYDADTLRLFLESAPIVQGEQRDLPAGAGELLLDILANDQLPAEYSLQLLSPPEFGQAQLTPSDELIYLPPPNFCGSDFLTYEVCNIHCADLCDTAVVAITLEEPEFFSLDSVSLPNAITPNGDGLNDRLVFDFLEANRCGRFRNPELVIFNRWGDVLFEAQPYQNDWDGRDRDGRELPQATYYYILRLRVPDGLVIKGDVTILK